MDQPTEAGDEQGDGSSKLSYKFQRLREKLRAAIASGELNGKLPGERQLAKRFHVNAKTLSKALTDLAAEGLLDRSIGRGTFVKGSTSAAPNTGGDRWVIVCDPEQLNSGVIEHLKQSHDNTLVVTDITTIRPSFLGPVRAVIDLSNNTPDSFLRDLIVRNITVVLVGREPTTYSVNAVLIDRSLGASCLARDMMLAGHRRFLAVERRGQTAVADAIRQTARRFAPEATVDSVYPADVTSAVEQTGITAIVCDTRRSAVQVRDALLAKGISIPGQVSLAAIGSGTNDYPCSGYFLNVRQKAETVAQLIGDTNVKRPTTIWLTGTYLERGSIAGVPIGPMPMEQERPSMSFGAAPRI